MIAYLFPIVRNSSTTVARCGCFVGIRTINIHILIQNLCNGWDGTSPYCKQLIKGQFALSQNSLLQVDWRCGGPRITNCVRDTTISRRLSRLNQWTRRRAYGLLLSLFREKSIYLQFTSMECSGEIYTSPQFTS